MDFQKSEEAFYMDLSEIKAMEAYDIITEEDLPDIHAEGILLRHRKSGARVMLIPAEDDNKVFNIAFRTPPEDSTGVAHIIEHSVLCGSREFPLKDPFVELVKGSLNTFLNAMTYPDKTMYPVASTNDTDFRNLMHVYLDAVFYPDIYSEQNIFRQEGWSWRLEKTEDPLTLNGVVYNEMKGVFSSPEELLDRMTFNILFPDTPYGVESGGDPEVIPTLSYEKFLAFHKKYYHPSNSYIYLYGNLDMADTLKWMDEKYLSAYERTSVDSEIKRQKPFSKSRRLVGRYPVSDDEPVRKNTYLSYNVVAGNPLDIKESIAFDVLDYALLSSPGAPVKKALLDHHIGNDIYGSYNDGILQPYYSITAKNASASDEKEFLRIIREELEKQVSGGIDRKALVAGINFLEFQFREADFSSYPKGLMYSIDVFDSWLYDENSPFTALRQLDAYAELKKDAENGYFENLIREKFLGNTYSATVILKPEKGLAQAKEAAAVKKFADYKAALPEKELRRLVRETHALKKYQERPERPEDIAKLPTLMRSDIKKEERNLSNIEDRIAVPGNGAASFVKTVYHDAASNGIGYVDLLWNIKKIPAELIPVLGILKSVLVNVDTEHYTYGALNNEINANTGGLSCGVSVFDDPEDENGYLAFFGIRCKALYEKLDFAFDLIREIITTSVFTDEKRIYEILASAKSQMQITMQQMGHQTAVMRAEAYYSSAGAFNDLVGGIGFYKVLKEYEENYSSKKDEVREQLGRLLHLVFDAENLTVSYTSEAAGRGALVKNLPKVLIRGEEAFEKTPEITLPPLGRLNEAFKTAGQVQYVAAAGNFKKAGLAYTGALNILRQIMSYDYLWQNIRVKGGAYGCAAAFKRNGDGLFTSFRDPNLGRTLDVFKKVPSYLKKFEADEAKMTKYIIGTMSDLDAPLTPSLFGTVSMRAYLSGVTQADMQASRKEILTAEEDDIRALSRMAQAVLKSGCICVVGSEAAIEKEKERFDHIETLL